MNREIQPHDLLKYIGRQVIVRQISTGKEKQLNVVNGKTMSETISKDKIIYYEFSTETEGVKIFIDE